jgi:hypothetical protein
MKKNISGYSMEPSVFETDNNNSSNYGARTPNKINKSEIITIINKNLNYFNKKKQEEKKFVINTIRIPKSLNNLNNKLPVSQYESDINNKRKEFYGLSFQNNKVLPLLRARYNSTEKENNKINLKKDRNRRNYDNSSDLVNSKSMELIQQKNSDDNNEISMKRNERKKRFGNYNKFNTLKMMVDKNRPFNHKGKIDIIVEE